VVGAQEHVVREAEQQAEQDGVRPGDRGGPRRRVHRRQQRPADQQPDQNRPADDERVDQRDRRAPRQEGSKRQPLPPTVLRFIGSRTRRSWHELGDSDRPSYLSVAVS